MDSTIQTMARILDRDRYWLEVDALACLILDSAIANFPKSGYKDFEKYLSDQTLDQASQVFKFAYKNDWLGVLLFSQSGKSDPFQAFLTDVQQNIEVMRNDKEGSDREPRAKRKKQPRNLD